MQLPEERQNMIVKLRPRFISTVNPNKSEWSELTFFEKQEVDKRCKKFISMLQF